MRPTFRPRFLLLFFALSTFVFAQAPQLTPQASYLDASHSTLRLEVDGKAFAVLVPEIVTVRKSMLGATRASVAGERHNLVRALDLLFTGF